MIQSVPEKCFFSSLVILITIFNPAIPLRKKIFNKNSLSDLSISPLPPMILVIPVRYILYIYSIISLYSASPFLYVFISGYPLVSTTSGVPVIMDTGILLKFSLISWMT